MPVFNVITFDLLYFRVEIVMKIVWDRLEDRELCRGRMFSNLNYPWDVAVIFAIQMNIHF